MPTALSGSGEAWKTPSLKVVFNGSFTSGTADGDLTIFNGIHAVKVECSIGE